MFKWLAAGFVALVFGALSFNAFIANTLSDINTGNRFIQMFVDIYGWLFGMVGSLWTGIIFALLAIGILIAAYMDKSE